MEVFIFENFVYWTLFNTNQFLFATALQTEMTSNAELFVFATVCLFSTVAVIIGIVWRWKSFKSYRKDLFNVNYGNWTFALEIVGWAILNSSLLLGIVVLGPIYYLSFLVPLGMIAYGIIWRPFRSIFNNVRFVFNYIALAVVLVLISVISNDSENLFTFSFPIGILFCMVLVFLVNFGVCIYSMVFKLIGNDRDIKSESNDEEMNEIRKKFKD